MSGTHAPTSALPPESAAPIPDDAPLTMTPSGPEAAAAGPAPHGAPAAPGAEACAAGCPLARIPASVWRGLLRPPFRRRHPFVFWGGLAVLLAALLYAFFPEGGLGGHDRLALVNVRGPILSAEPTLDWVRKLERNPNVKGVLVRVDSPGGGAAASQEIYTALARLAEKKPVAVSMGSLAASGGLMVSMAGRRVFANPSTVTGSIGVRMDIPQVQGLLQKLGLGQETLTTAPYKDAGSYLRPLTPEQRRYFAAVLEDMHRQFVGIVAQGRRMSPDKAAELANGKIYTGREALALGLVDALGDRQDALEWLARECGVPAQRPLLSPPEGRSWLSRTLKTWLGLDVNGLAGLTESAAPAFLYQF
ncbi:signal peptide peptidase SppA [Desulfovibrio legallii]|uniref:Signal peptide peptidase A. Serine peptidase. MEROPS family S49 n=1 Tax=Desulfovibrio legallii TaxID=571438 RepID=A0A1G7MC10_9BACT|nr:signal peptide peptidase SppA [Desulfovibrio legallii]SDF59176.1 signal peptide peptidase A. Serine peptidase. MEROPS family S49 [Desulfovibrio legallii]